MKGTAKTVVLVMIIMVLSRFMSLVSISIYTAAFGNTNELNIYSYALYLPNIIFNSLGTSLAIVVIPIFGGYIGTGDKSRAFKFADNVITISVALTAVLSIIGVLAAPIFPMFTEFKYQGYDLAVTALRILFPVMIFYGLNYVLQGILQSLGRFNMPAFVSVPSSLIVILYVLFLGDRFGIMGLVVATFIGLSLQGLILIPPVYKTEYRYKPSFDLRNEDIRKAARLIPPILIGTSAYQLNFLYNITVTATFENTVTIMTLVQNLILSAVLAFIYSLTAVMFPQFTVYAAQNDLDGLKKILMKVLSTILYILIPAAAGFFAIRSQLLSLLVGWGKMTPADVNLASGFLALYALGVAGIGIKEVVDRAFYALKDTRSPAIIGVVIMFINVIATRTFIGIFGVYGIPLSFSISTTVGGVLIIYIIRRKIGQFGLKQLLRLVIKLVLASVVMVGIVSVINYLIFDITSGVLLLDRILKLFIPVAAGGITYYGITYIMGVEEAIEVLSKVKMKLMPGRAG